MSIDSFSDESIDNEDSTEHSIDDQYYAEAQEFDLLTREEEAELSSRILEGSKAYGSLVDRMRHCLAENVGHPKVQELLTEIRDLVPANFTELLLRSGEVQLSAAAQDMGNPDAALLHAALDLTKQKEEIHFMMFGQRLSKEENEERVDVNQLGFRILRIITLIEERSIPIAKELAKLGLREIIETKEPVIKHGESARNQMRESNLRLVMHWARHYQHRGLEYKDLVAEGNFGLMRAVEYFDHTKGFKFSTYATWWIKQCITRALANQGREIRIPTHLVEIIFDFRRRVTELETHYNRKIEDDEAIAIIGYEKAEAETLKQGLRMSTTLSLSYEYGSKTYGGKGDATTLGETLENHRTPSPDDEMEQERLREDQEKAFDILKAVLSVMEQRVELQKRECEIIRLRLGLDDGQPRTLQEIADVYGLSRERIRQAQKIVLKKLETKMAILQGTREAAVTGKENPFADYGDAMEEVENRLRYANKSKPLAESMRRRIEKFVTGVLNAEEEKVMRLRVGLDGPGMTQQEVAENLGMTLNQVTFMQNEALDWMRAALESPYELSSIEAPVKEDDDSHSMENFATLFEYLKYLCNSQPVDRMKSSRNGQAEATQAPARRLEHGEVGYFDGKNASMNLDPIFAGKKGTASPVQQDSEKQKPLSARGAFERLFGEVIAKEETNGNNGFPGWVRLLPESTATRLHTLLMKSVSTSEVRDFLLKAEPGLAQQQKYLQKALQDCFAKQEETAEVLRKWIQQFDEGGHLPGQYVTSPHFLRAAENEKLIIPNVRNIINRHFAGSDVPPADRRLVVAGDIQCAPGFRDLFGDVIPLLKKSKLRGIINVPEMFQQKADVIILGHLSEMLRFEDDEKALLWAQSCLKPGGITIVIANDKMPEVPSRAHFRSKFNTAGERVVSAARYQEFMAGRGFATEMGKATLELESQTPEGLAATGELLRFTLPSGIQSHITQEDIETYLERYVKGKGSEEKNTLHYSLMFLVAHENPHVRFSLKTPQPILDAVERGMKSGIGIEQLNNLFAIRDWQSKASAMIDANKQKEGSFIPPVPVEPKLEQERSYARNDVKDSKEYFKLFWQNQRLIHGKRYGKRTEEEVIASLMGDESAYLAYINRPMRTESKRRFSKPERQFNPKVQKRYEEKLRDMNDRLLHVREENAYTIDPKIGEIIINGKRCVKTRYFASVYGLDVNTLKQAVSEFGLQPAGYALEKDSEHDALEMGGRTAVFALDELLEIPYVKAKVENEHGHLAAEFSHEKPVAVRDRRNAFLRDLDAEITAIPETPAAVVAELLETTQETCKKIITQWKLYADGSRHQSSKDTQPELPGAWAYILKDAEETEEEVRSEPLLTPNIDRMELMAVVAGLERIRERYPELTHQVEIFSDSQYVFERFMQLLPQRQADTFLERSSVYRSWKAHGDIEAPHQCDTDLLYALEQILHQMQVTFVKVEKLTAPAEHTRCDTIAVLARRRLAAELGFHTTRDADQLETHPS